MPGPMFRFRWSLDPISCCTRERVLCQTQLEHRTRIWETAPAQEEDCLSVKRFEMPLHRYEFYTALPTVKVSNGCDHELAVNWVPRVPRLVV